MKGLKAVWRAHTTRYWIALILSALLTIPTLADAVRQARSWVGQPPSWTRFDLDTSLIHDGLLQAPQFPDTLQWWVGTWAGEVPFYRPLTSYVFWIEWKLFGDEEWRYVVPTAAAHLIATLLSATVAYRLAERWRVAWPAVTAVLTAAAFTGLTREYRTGVVSMVVGSWKNQPDSFATICCFLGVLAYLRAQSTSRGWPGSAVGWYLAACCFKEIAIPLPAVFGALEFLRPRESKGRNAWTRTVSVMAAGAAFLLFRHWALGGVGYAYGTNTRWLDRSILEFAGPLQPMLSDGFWLGCAAALFICALAVVGWRYRLKWSRRPYGSTIGIAGLVLLLFVGWTVIGLAFLRVEDPQWWRNEPWDVRMATALILLQNPIHLSSGLGVLFTIAASVALWKQSRPVLLYAPWWTAVFLTPLVFSPGPSHRYYLPQVGYIFFTAMGSSALLRQVLAAIRSPWQRSVNGETSGKTGLSAIQ